MSIKYFSESFLSISKNEEIEKIKRNQLRTSSFLL